MDFLSDALADGRRFQALPIVETFSPVDNAFMEGFRGKFRDECLNENWYISLDHARRVIEDRRIDYNRHRPPISRGPRPGGIHTG